MSKPLDSLPIAEKNLNDLARKCLIRVADDIRKQSGFGNWTVGRFFEYGFKEGFKEGLAFRLDENPSMKESETE